MATKPTNKKPINKKPINKKPMYLDYAASTPVDPKVMAVMQECLELDGDFGNPASVTHSYGWAASQRIEIARKQVADLIKCEPKSIVFTSGATESNNLAILGAARQAITKTKNHIITVSTEHKAVLQPCQALASEGFDVSFVKPMQNGLLDLNNLEKLITKNTLLISVMHVNNETGVVQNIAKIGKIAKKHDVIFHVDAAQSLGKLPIDVDELNVDLMSFSAHKIYGPKGVGALYVRRYPRVRLAPLLFGGQQEDGMRPGTLATHQIAGFGEACRIANECMSEDKIHCERLRHLLYEGLMSLGGVHVNGSYEHLSPVHLNVSIEGVDGESLLLSLEHIAVSAGSACSSTHVEPSHVLTALGVPRKLAQSTIRFSVGRFTRADDMVQTIEYVRQEIQRLRDLSPWQIFGT